MPAMLILDKARALDQMLYQATRPPLPAQFARELAGDSEPALGTAFAREADAFSAPCAEPEVLDHTAAPQPYGGLFAAIGGR
jgi:hypothetical protein